MKNETSPEEYWAGIEQDLGETVLAYALAQIVQRSEIVSSGFLAPRPRWGLVFVTDSTLYIDERSEPSWIQRLMTTRQPKKEQERKVIPRDTILEITIPPRKTGLSAFFAGPETGVDIIYAADRNGIRIVLDRRAPQDRKLLDILATI